MKEAAQKSRVGWGQSLGAEHLPSIHSPSCVLIQAHQEKSQMTFQRSECVWSTFATKETQKAPFCPVTHTDPCQSVYMAHVPFKTHHRRSGQEVEAMHYSQHHSLLTEMTQLLGQTYRCDKTD